MRPQDFLKEYNRMHNSYSDGPCSECPLYDLPCQQGIADMEPEDFAVMYDKVAEWSDSHPIKTRQSEFLKIFPEVAVDNSGVICVGPCRIFPDMGDGKYCGRQPDCPDCRKDFWLRPIDESVPTE